MKESENQHVKRHVANGRDCHGSHLIGGSRQPVNRNRFARERRSRHISRANFEQTKRQKPALKEIRFHEIFTLLRFLCFGDSTPIQLA